MNEDVYRMTSYGKAEQPRIEHKTSERWEQLQYANSILCYFYSQQEKIRKKITEYLSSA